MKSAEDQMETGGSRSVIGLILYWDLLSFLQPQLFWRSEAIHSHMNEEGSISIQCIELDVCFGALGYRHETVFQRRLELFIRY